MGWTPANERTITVRFHTSHCGVVQVYAPTEVAADSVKDELYDQLQSDIDEMPSFDIILVMDYFNVKLSGVRSGIPSRRGPHGSADDFNDNGERLLSLCSTSCLGIGNTLFQHKRIHKRLGHLQMASLATHFFNISASTHQTWTSPNCMTSNEIDYICINNRWRCYLQDVRAYRGADVGLYHNLFIRN